MAHFLAIKALLEPDELAQLLAVGERMSAEQLEFLIAQISAASPDAAATLLRGVFAELHRANLIAETKWWALQKDEP